MGAPSLCNLIAKLSTSSEKSVQVFNAICLILQQQLICVTSMIDLPIEGLQGVYMPVVVLIGEIIINYGEIDFYQKLGHSQDFQFMHWLVNV